MWEEKIQIVIYVQDTICVFNLAEQTYFSYLHKIRWIKWIQLEPLKRDRKHFWVSHSQLSLWCNG